MNTLPSKQGAIQATAMAVLGMVSGAVVFSAAPSTTSLFVNTGATQVVTRYV